MKPNLINEMKEIRKIKEGWVKRERDDTKIQKEMKERETAARTNRSIIGEIK